MWDKLEEISPHASKKTRTPSGQEAYHPVQLTVLIILA
jgi:hypothetical protein